MAPFAKNFSLFLLLTLLSSFHPTHARDSQFFNKIPSTTTPAATTTTPAATTTTSTSTSTAALPNNQQLPNSQQQQEQEPDFNPENENSYGLYSHESGQLPPSTTTTTSAASTAAQPLNKHLPKNYNPVAYVTVPEDNNDNSELTEENSFSTNPTNYNNNAASQNYYNTLQEQQEENYPSTKTPNYENNNNNYMGGGSSFNSRPQGLRNGFQPQGMSDTRFMENGKYFYDVNNEKYSNNHPYESLKGVQSTNQYSNNRNYYGNRGNGVEYSNNRNYYGNRGNGNEFDNVNFMGGNGYQNQDESQNEENYNMP